MMDWFKGLSMAARVVVAVVLLVAAIWLGLFVRDLIVGSKDVEAKLGTEQAGAAMQSGTDAVETVGNNQASEEAIDAQVQETENEVNNSNDAAAADDAGRSGLCLNFGLCD